MSSTLGSCQVFVRSFINGKKEFPIPRLYTKKTKQAAKLFVQGRYWFSPSAAFLLRYSVHTAISCEPEKGRAHTTKDPGEFVSKLKDARLIILEGFLAKNNNPGLVPPCAHGQLGNNCDLVA